MNMTAQNPTCQVCGQGELKRKKKYRMSVPVVIIGYIFLIPSLLGILFGVLMMSVTGNVASETSIEIENEVREQMQSVGLSEEVVERVIAREPLSEDQNSLLTDQQARVIADAKLSYSAGQVGAGAGTALAGGFSILVIMFSFVSGLVGWLLIMKKKVLECERCNAVVAAS